MYRPIDVIFRHPVKKFSVIYQDGVLWQLPKLDFDSQSLLYKKRYRGSRKEIFVAANQMHNPDDANLLQQLLTIELPNSVVGRDVDEFDHWWRYNWFKYSDLVAQKIIQQKNASQLGQNSTIPSIASPTVAQFTPFASSIDVNANGKTSGMANIGENLSSSNHASNTSDDKIYGVLDDMLDDLLNE